MKFHIGETMTPTGNLLPLAAAASRLGYDGYCVSDSIIYPKISDTTYSYGEGGRAFLENKDVVESFVLASAIGASQPSLEVTTSVVKLTVRHPVYAAKLACSVSALTGGRFNFGVGLSVWPEDYSVLGIPYERRGARLDECIEIVRGLSTGKYFEFHGQFYDLPPIKLSPAAPDLPILVGGHSDAALRRAAHNDGWTCAGATPEQLAEMISKLRDYRKDVEQTRRFRIFETHLGAIDYDQVRRKADAGVTDLILYFRNIYDVKQDLEKVADKVARFEAFAENTMSRIKR